LYYVAEIIVMGNCMICQRNKCPAFAAVAMYCLGL